MQNRNYIDIIKPYCYSVMLRDEIHLGHLIYRAVGWEKKKQTNNFSYIYYRKKKKKKAKHDTFLKFRFNNFIYFPEFTIYIMLTSNLMIILVFIKLNINFNC